MNMKKKLLMTVGLALLPVAYSIFTFYSSANIDTEYTAQVVGTIQIYSILGFILSILVFTWSLYKYLMLKGDVEEKSVKMVSNVVIVTIFVVVLGLLIVTRLVQ
jgi:hypothetical protein